MDGQGKERKRRKERDENQRAPPREWAARVGRAYSSTVACRAPSASSRWRTLNAMASVKLDPSTIHAVVGCTQYVTRSAAKTDTPNPIRSIGKCPPMHHRAIGAPGLGQAVCFAVSDSRERVSAACERPWTQLHNVSPRPGVAHAVSGRSPRTRCSSRRYSPRARLRVVLQNGTRANCVYLRCPHSCRYGERLAARLRTRATAGQAPEVSFVTATAT